MTVMIRDDDDDDDDDDDQVDCVESIIDQLQIAQHQKIFRCHYT